MEHVARHAEGGAVTEPVSTGNAHGSLAHGSLAHGSLAHGSLAHGSLAHGSLAHGSLAHGSLARVSLVQMACGPDRADNVDRAEAHVRAAAAGGAQIVCLQELFAGRYFPQVVDVRGYHLAESLPSPTTLRMQTLARELAVVLVVPVYERAMPGVLFNSAVVFDADGTDLGTFRKNHIPDAPQYLEKYYFTPGDLGWPVFRTRYGTIGIAICWDEWFPEASRILGLKGAQIIFYPSAIGSEPDHPELSTREAWKTVIRGHGIANGLFVATVNRVGTEDQMSFYGGSFIGGPLGEVLAEASDEEGVVSATLDLDAITVARELLQFHRDRRPDTYGEILCTIGTPPARHPEPTTDRGRGRDRAAVTGRP